MNENTPVANAKFDGMLADEIVRLNRIVKDLEVVISNLNQRINWLESENNRLETIAYLVD